MKKSFIAWVASFMYGSLFFIQFIRSGILGGDGISIPHIYAMLFSAITYVVSVSVSAGDGDTELAPPVSVIALSLSTISFAVCWSMLFISDEHSFLMCGAVTAAGLLYSVVSSTSCS